MPRLQVIDPKSATGKAKEIFEGPLRGKHLNIFKGMANSPAALKAYLGLSGALGEGLLDAKERETIALAVGEANGCEYCVSAHTMLGKQAGLTEEQTLAARRGKIDDPKLGALVRFVHALREKKGSVTDDDLKAFRSAGYTDGHAVEAVACVALNVFTNYFNHLNHTDVDLPAAPRLG